MSDTTHLGWVAFGRELRLADEGQRGIDVVLPTPAHSGVPGSDNGRRVLWCCWTHWGRKVYSVLDVIFHLFLSPCRLPPAGGGKVKGETPTSVTELSSVGEDVLAERILSYQGPVPLPPGFTAPFKLVLRAARDTLPAKKK